MASEPIQVPEALEDPIAELRQKLRGEVLVAGDAGYDEGRKVWNAMFDDRFPAAVLRCADEQDVGTAVALLAGVEAPLAIRGGGHHIAGFGGCEGGFVIDMSPMRWARVEDGGARMLVGGGATLHEPDTAGSEHGCAVPFGVVSETGVAGLALSGGIGWLTRRHGYTCDNLLGARVVSADGEVVVASEDEHSDLLWGLRGGGGNFGVVTEFEFRAHPVDEVLIAEAYHRVDGAEGIAPLLREYREWSGEASNDVTAWVVCERAGEAYAEFAPELVGELVVGFLGCSLDPQGGAKELEGMNAFGSPTLARTSPVRFVDLQHMQDSSSSAAPGLRSYMKGEMLTELTDAAIDGIAGACEQLPTAGSLFELGMVGGAMGEHDEMDAAVGLRNARYLGGFTMMARPGEDVDAGIAWARAAWPALRTGSAGGAYLNFDGEASEQRVLGSLGVGGEAQKHERLTEIKRRYDPANRFRVNHNIKP